MNENLESKKERWKARFWESQRKLWEAVDAPLPPKLYHYSGMNGVTGILTSQEIWLSDVRFMNDRNDGRYWLDVFRTVLNRKSVPDFVKRAFENRDFGLGASWHAFIACFSETRDLVNQWTHYADDGRGCAIQFSFEPLAQNYIWMKMLYDRQEQTEKAARTIDTAIHLARAEDLSTSESKLLYWSCAIFSFLQCGMQFKDPAYTKEKEYRVFAVKPNLRGVPRRPSPAGQIPYLSLALGPDTVSGLVKGPSCEAGTEELAALLRSNGYRQNVE